MRYIKFYGNAGYCGTDYEDYEAFDDSVEDKELDDISSDKIRDWGEGYEYLATSCFDEDDYATEEDAETAREELIESYWEDCEDGWVEVSEEEYLENKED